MKNHEMMGTNKRLAVLLGWANLVEVGGALVGRPPDGAENSRGQAAVPNWAGDWAAIGPLAAKHQVDVLHNWGSVHAKWSAAGAARAPVDSEDRNRDAATRLALTRAVADKLEAGQ